MELREIFDKFGIVDSTTIIKDKYSFKTMRFGYVEMPNDEEAQKAIKTLNGKAINGRKLNVHKARVSSNDRRNSGRNGGRRCTDC